MEFEDDEDVKPVEQSKVYKKSKSRKPQAAEKWKKLYPKVPWPLKDPVEADNEDDHASRF